MSRYAVGIDLGTTHCAMAVASLDEDPERAARDPRRCRSSSLEGELEPGRSCRRSSTSRTRARARRRSRGTPARASPWASTRARAASRHPRGSSRAPRAGSRTPRSTGARASCRSAPRGRGEDLPRRGVVALPRAPLRGVRRALRRRRRGARASRTWSSRCPRRSTPPRASSRWRRRSRRASRS